MRFSDTSPETRQARIVVRCLVVAYRLATRIGLDREAVEELRQAIVPVGVAARVEIDRWSS